MDFNESPTRRSSRFGIHEATEAWLLPAMQRKPTVMATVQRSERDHSKGLEAIKMSGRDT